MIKGLTILSTEFMHFDEFDGVWMEMYSLVTSYQFSLDGEITFLRKLMTELKHQCIKCNKSQSNWSTNEYHWMKLLIPQYKLICQPCSGANKKFTRIKRVNFDNVCKFCDETECKSELNCVAISV